MSDVFSIPSQPTLVPWRKDLDYMMLADDMQYQVYHDPIGLLDPTIYQIRRGFITDGASIPYGVRWIIGQPFWPRFQAATLIHDFLYKEQPCSRKEADRIFYDMLETQEVGDVRKWLMYTAVRAFGFIAWAKRRRELSKP